MEFSKVVNGQLNETEKCPLSWSSYLARMPLLFYLASGSLITMWEQKSDYRVQWKWSAYPSLCTILSRYLTMKGWGIRDWLLGEDLEFGDG